MKIYSKIFILLILFISLFNISNWSFFEDLFDDNNWPEIHYCQDDECWIIEWINEVKNNVDDNIVVDEKASSYIQSIIKYLLWFIYFVAVALIIYAWFNLLIWGWEEEKTKKSKTMIIYVIIWIAIIFLASPIFEFVLQILNSWNISDTV